MYIMTLTRFLQVGDTVGWSVYMNANNGGTTIHTVANAAGICTYGFATMIGF
jgi:hypothetical protein